MPASSRIKRKYNENNLTIDQMLLAMIADGISYLLWQNGGAKKSRKPVSIFKKLTEKEKPKDELMSFRTPEEYEAWAARKREIWNNG